MGNREVMPGDPPPSPNFCKKLTGFRDRRCILSMAFLNRNIYEFIQLFPLNI